MTAYLFHDLLSSRLLSIPVDISQQLSSQSLSGSLRLLISTISQSARFREGLVPDVLVMVASAFVGLYQSHIIQAVSSDFLTIALLINDLAPLFVRGLPMVVFSHGAIAATVLDLFRDRVVDAHSALVRIFEAEQYGSHRVLELPHHLQKSGSLEQLAQEVTGLDFIIAAWDARLKRHLMFYWKLCSNADAVGFESALAGSLSQMDSWALSAKSIVKMTIVADALLEAGFLHKADQVVQKSRSLVTTGGQSESSAEAGLLLVAARVLERSGQDDAAVDAVSRSVKLSEVASGVDATNMTAAIEMMGKMLLRNAKYENSEAAFARFHK